MSLIGSLIDRAERLPVPDGVTRAGISALVGRSKRALSGRPDSNRAFADGMADFPIAEHTDDANSQHYELPADFFGLILGPRRKYSCCLYEGDDTLAAAEERALDETARHADLADGQAILELGCGWGSLTLWMAEHYPHATITAVSNSSSQRAYIEAEARRRGFANVTVITADMNVFAPKGTFDRIVSVEMFEHMANWRPLLQRIRTWLRPDGRVFLHVFSHRSQPYRFDHRDPSDWIARHFFTGGIMPSHDLIRAFNDIFAVEADWTWNGANYEKTANDWLANFDRARDRIDPILASVYGSDAALWRRRWRLFFLATAGLFGHSGGTEWCVSHYRLKAA